MPRSLHQRRFTLLELLLVMVVIGITAGLLAPRLTGSIAGQRLQAQARTVISLSRKARALAAGEGRAYELVIDREGKQLRLTCRRDPLAEADDPDDPEREAVREESEWSRPIAFAEDVTLSDLLLAGEAPAEDSGLLPAIRFRPDGTADDAELEFTLSGKDTVRVVIDPHLGQARVLEEEVPQ
ncbi:MAG TPA: hypothetical protein DEA08_35905 [Planctomycetes bacterium]|nr:hypothetical protein [Planctomycetota bacterium]